MGEFWVDKEGHLMHGQFWEWSSGVPRSEGGKVLLTNETEAESAAPPPPFSLTSLRDSQRVCLSQYYFF
jgi:hypothetical protein